MAEFKSTISSQDFDKALHGGLDYAADKGKFVKTVNGTEPDENGNVNVTGGSVELDTTLSVSGKAADAKAVGDALENVNTTNIYIGENTSTTVDEEGNVTTTEGSGGSGSGGNNSGGSSAFVLLDTVDFSAEDMAAMGSKKTFSVDGVEEILLVWEGMQNSTTTKSWAQISLGGVSYNAIATGVSGTGVYGYTIIKVYNGVGTHLFMTTGAIAGTNYAPTSIGNVMQTVYNLLPIVEPITTFGIGNPATQYYAVGGTVKVYVR